MLCRTNVLVLVLVISARVLAAEDTARTSVRPEPGWTRSDKFEEVFRTREGEWLGCLQVDSRFVPLVRGANETYVALQREALTFSGRPVSAKQGGSHDKTAAESAPSDNLSSTRINLHRNMPALTEARIRELIEAWEQDRDRSAIEQIVAKAATAERPADKTAPRPPRNLFFVRGANQGP